MKYVLIYSKIRLPYCLSKWSLQDLFAKSICPISDTSQSLPSSHKPSKCQNGKSQISLTWLPGSLAKARGAGGLKVFL